MAEEDDAGISSEEEDDDYNPATDPTAEKKSKKRKADQSEPERPDQSLNCQENEKDEDDPKRLAKRAKIQSYWDELKAKALARLKGFVSGSGSEGQSQLTFKDKLLKRIQEGNVCTALAAVCRPVTGSILATGKMGYSQPQKKGSSQQGIKQVDAAAAMQMAKNAPMKAGPVGLVEVKEKAKFAGQTIEVTKKVDQGTKEELDKAADQSSGLDAVINELSDSKKVNVVDKSRMDWSGFKDKDKEVQEELDVYMKSSDKYTEKKDFLKRAELNEYEQEREIRLGSDVRTRGRL